MSYESTHNSYDIRRAFLIGTIDGKLFDVSTHLTVLRQKSYTQEQLRIMGSNELGN